MLCLHAIELKQVYAPPRHIGQRVFRTNKDKASLVSPTEHHNTRQTLHHSGYLPIAPDC